MKCLTAEVAADRHTVALAQRKQLKNREPRADGGICDDIGVTLRISNVVIVPHTRLCARRPIALCRVGQCGQKDEKC